MEKILEFIFFKLPLMIIFLISIVCTIWLFKIEFNFIKPLTKMLSEDPDCNVMLIFTMWICPICWTVVLFSIFQYISDYIINIKVIKKGLN